MEEQYSTPREFTSEELRVWYRPRTWFRRKLVERPQEEFDQNPTLGLELTLLAEELVVGHSEIKTGQINQKQYEKRLQCIRRGIGNIIYK